MRTEIGALVWVCASQRFARLFNHFYEKAKKLPKKGKKEAVLTTFFHLNRAQSNPIMASKRKRAETVVTGNLGFLPIGKPSGQATPKAPGQATAKPPLTAKPNPPKSVIKSGRGKFKTVKEALGRDQPRQSDEGENTGLKTREGRARFEHNVVVPVTVHQLIMSPALFLKKQWISLVGQIKSKDSQVHEVSFQLEDGTGQICCKADPELPFFQPSDDQDGQPTDKESESESYVFLIGMLNMGAEAGADEEGEHHPQIILTFAETLYDLNRLTHHMLSVRFMSGQTAFPSLESFSSVGSFSSVDGAIASAKTEENSSEAESVQKVPSALLQDALLQYLKNQDTETGISQESALSFLMQNKDFSSVCTSEDMATRVSEAFQRLETTEALIYEVSPGQFRAVS